MTFRKRCLVSSAGAALAASIATPALAGDVVGTVLDASETITLKAAQVRIVELDRVATTERDGSFLFADVPAGEYTLEVTYVGAPAVRRTVVVPADRFVRADILVGGDNSREILVLGQSANLASALSRKRANDGISDVLTRDAIGQFPDQNVAESMRRTPGVNVLNDQGEGRFVSVRGLDPELNATSLNGVRLPAPESDVRSVALDVISSDIIESIEIKKSLTPDMDADTIGASIEIETTSAFDRRRNLLTAKAEGSYNDLADHVSPKGSVDFAARISDNFGISGGASYYQRKFETDNVEADGWSDDDGLIFPEEVNYRDYNVERERISANLNFDVRLGDSTALYLRGLYSQFEDQEYRREVSFKLEDAGEIDGGGTTVEFSDAGGELALQRSIKDRFETQKIRSVVFGGETDTGTWKADYSVSWAKSSEREDGSVDPANFEQFSRIQASSPGSTSPIRACRSTRSRAPRRTTSSIRQAMPSTTSRSPRCRIRWTRNMPPGSISAARSFQGRGPSPSRRASRGAGATSRTTWRPSTGRTTPSRWPTFWARRIIA